MGKLKTNIKFFLALILSFFLLSTLNLPVSNAAEKAGSKCTTFGKTVVKGKTKLTCVKVTEFKWVAVPLKPIVSSVYNPVLPGNKFKINSLQFEASSVNFDFGSEVCRGNAFNNGCIFDSALKPIVDSDSPNRWIGVDLIITNLTKKSIGAVDLSYSFYMILPTGKYIENAREVLFENAPINISLLPGIPTTMRVAFALPKVVENLNPILVIKDDSGDKSKEYFFYLNW